eukprot:2846326-Amphidinium_carterae.1
MFLHQSVELSSLKSQVASARALVNEVRERSKVLEQSHGSALSKAQADKMDSDRRRLEQELSTRSQEYALESSAVDTLRCEIHECGMNWRKNVWDGVLNWLKGATRKLDKRKLPQVHDPAAPELHVAANTNKKP